MGSLNLNRKLFKRSAGISFIALVALLALLVATGTVFAAAPIAGVGGFVIEADAIDGNDFELIPALTSTNTAHSDPAGANPLANQYQKVYPAAQVWLGDVSIDGLNLWKNISLVAIAHTFGIQNVSYVKVAIGATGTVTGSELIMNATDIVADEADFTNMIMMENLPTDHPNPLTNAQKTNGVTQGPYEGIGVDNPINTGVQIGMSADTMYMENGIINTHYMKAGEMKIPGMTLQLQLYDNSGTQILPPFQNKEAPWD